MSSATAWITSGCAIRTAAHRVWWKFLQARGIRGLIVAGLQSDGVLPPSHAELWPGFSTVVIGLRPQEPPLHFTSNDQFSTARHAVAALRRSGYSRLGLVINLQIDAWLEKRFSDGFFSGENGSERLLFDFAKTEREAFGRWLRLEPAGRARDAALRSKSGWGNRSARSCPRSRWRTSIA